MMLDEQTDPGAEPIAGHRYWRFAPTTWNYGSAGNSQQQITYSISFFSSADGSGADLCMGKTASAFSEFNATYSASKANDNNASTRWTSGYNSTGFSSQWWQIDAGVGSSIDVHSVSINFSFVGYIPAAAALQYSDNGTDWTQQAAFVPANTAGIQTFTNL